MESTSNYEDWLRAQTAVVEEDLDEKHDKMAGKHEALPFFRATFYRWAEQFPHRCPGLMAAPLVLGVGDVHLDNFGTWRDAEGRLVWGINDFDEAATVPYTNDVVRLAAGALVAGTGDPSRVASAILDGYRGWLARGGQPLVVEEDHRRLRDLAVASLGHPNQFWDRFLADRIPVADVPADVVNMLEAALPASAETLAVFRRRSGLGSLGRPRFVVAVEWQGGMVARETKRLVPSAWAWATGHLPADRPLVTDLLATAVRCPDPYVSVQGWWQTRRLAADCRRIDVTTLRDTDDLLYLLRAMGRELANIHLADANVEGITEDLRGRPAGWLSEAAQLMVAVTVDDWQVWRHHWNRHKDPAP